MSNWMRRRIERSRARCEKPAGGQKPDKNQAAEKQTNPTGNAPLESAVKGN